MAYYTYYQRSQPTWGTQQYQSIAPPIPTYQPQPSWHGADYYRAHADSLDNTLFDYVWAKVKRMIGGAGVKRKEAKYWWKRVYGGLDHPSKLLPADLGAAAAYEAMRCWEYHRSVYVQPLSDNREREREALIGLATAEASKLWAYAMRPHDTRGRLDASEVAAATASRMFNNSYNYGYAAHERRPRSRSRRRSISGTRYDSDIPDDGYMDDDDLLDSYPSRGRYARRSSSVYRRSPSPYARRSPSPYLRRSPSPVPYSAVEPNAVGLSTSAYPSQYVTDGGIPGVYYPSAAATYTSYRQRSPSPYGYGRSSPYVGSSVGLPPPPTGQYLAAPGTPRHHRSHSAGAYQAVRPTFRY